MSSNDKDVYSLLFSYQKNVRAAQVKEKRQVLERVIEIVKLIGKRGLSYRSINDAAYCLDNVNIDHGNFLEILILLSKFDPLMKNHLDIVTEKSKQRHVTCAASGTKGRGGLVTFISSTTVNYVIESVRRMIKASIADEIQSAGMFSVQLDTTQDVSVKDQCSIVIRYVKDHIYERLVSVSNCTNSTGKGMFELFRDEIVKMGINIENCVGNSTDGAANMQGQYSGFTKWLSEASPNQVHVWCYAHVLKLVLVDTTQTTKAAISIFQLINKCAVFLRESYIRMDIWASKQSNNRRLNVIGETHWWAKDHALKKIFGSFNNPSTSLYIELIETLQELASSEDFNPTVRDTAQTLLDKCISFETILTVQVFLRIFQHTASLSKYLQTSGMDVLQVYRNVDCTIKALRDVSRHFDGINASAKKFVEWANNSLEDLKIDVTVEAALPEKKAMSGERRTHEAVGERAIDCYRITVHNCVMDKVVKTLEERFKAQDTLFADMTCLNPENFYDIKKNGIQPTALVRLSSILTKFNKDATASNLQSELIDFSLKWSKFKKTVPEEYLGMNLAENRNDNDELKNDEETAVSSSFSEDKETHGKCKSSKNCPVCCFTVLHKYNFYSKAYTHLYNAYKLLLT
nr:uncharacterized protein LOC101239087 [Hydra vulgaris]